MTDAPGYEQLYSHDTIYLPPAEEGSTPLEVCLGCSWGRCRFCDFSRDSFKVHPRDRLDHDLRVLARLQPESPRMFFLGENAFCLPTGTLLGIMSLARQRMPRLQAFAMYSRVDDISRKSDAELLQLKRAGLDALHVGAESGCDEILFDMDKGITSEDTVRELTRLGRAGIHYHVTLIGGLGGRALSRRHALDTAALLDRIHPLSVWTLKLHPYPGTALYDDYLRGDFDLMTPAEVLREDCLLLSSLTAPNFIFADTTVLDEYSLIGMLPEQLGSLLAAAEHLLGLSERSSL